MLIFLLHDIYNFWLGYFLFTRVFQHLESFWYNAKELTFNLKYKLAKLPGLVAVVFVVNGRDLPFHVASLIWEEERAMFWNVIGKYLDRLGFKTISKML